MYNFLRCPPPPFIIFSNHSLIIHEFLRPLFSVCRFPWVKVECIFPVRRNTANRLTMCAYSRPRQSSSGQYPDAGCLRLSLFQSVYLLGKTIY